MVTDRRRVSCSSEGAVDKGAEMAGAEDLQNLSKHDRDVIASFGRGRGRRREVGREELI